MSDDHENRRQKGQRTRVPTSRFERLAHIGWLTGEFALNGAAEGVRRLVGGASNDDSVFFNPAGAQLLAKRLARMRGAAMKVGQMLSLLDEEVLPREFAEAMAILRDAADTMPRSQVQKSLVNEYGTHWRKHFAHFDFEPIASASIGQVHTATLKDGREVALKIQYPGVAESIDSDVRNLASALKAARVLPIGLDIDGIVEEAKKQLAQEADYISESRYLLRYKALLADDRRYRVPSLIAELTTSRILVMERLLGVPVEDLAGTDHDQAQRDEMGARLIELLFRELFEFRLMQTDPNLANYLLLTGKTHCLGLLDFGSTSVIPDELADHYRAFFLALMERDRKAIAAAVQDIGFLHRDDPDAVRERVVDLFLVVFEPLAQRGSYDFSNAKIMSRAQALGMELAFEHGFLRSPPAQTMFLHRKLDGTLLLCGRIRARVDVRDILERVLM